MSRSSPGEETRVVGRESSVIQRLRGEQEHRVLKTVSSLGLDLRMHRGGW